MLDLKKFSLGASASVLMFLGACSQSGSRDTGSRVDSSSVSAGPAARRDALQKKGSLTPSERVDLGDACAECGDSSGAQSAYFGALDHGPLSRSEKYRAEFGLARIAERNGEAAAAQVRFRNAWQGANTDRERDAALAGLVRTDIRFGDFTSARAHRREIKNASSQEVQEIDSALGTAPPPAPSNPPGRASTTSGALAGRPKGRGLAPPNVIDRSQWHAKSMVKSRETEPMGQPRCATIHHTADLKPVGGSFGEVAERMASYQSYHQHDEGWADIGYHFVIDAQGRIWEGRELSIQGGHAGNKEANAGNVGVALIGNFNTAAPSAAQMRAAESLVAWLSAEYSIPESRIYGHAEIKKLYHLKGTNCPGTRFGPYLAQIRHAATGYRPGTRAGM